MLCICCLHFETESSVIIKETASLTGKYQIQFFPLCMYVSLYMAATPFCVLAPVVFYNAATNTQSFGKKSPFFELRVFDRSQVNQHLESLP